MYTARQRSRASCGPAAATGAFAVDSANTGNMVMLMCPNLKCRKVLRVPESCRGKHVRCQFCSTTFKVPDARRAGDTSSDRH